MEYQRNSDQVYLQTQNRKVRALWTAELGTTCRICGASPVEYHHLIPIRNGGTNDIGNIVPLCHVHHNKVHEKKTKAYRKNPQGRKRVEPKGDVDKTMKEYIDGRWQMREAMSILGLKRNKFNELLRDYRARTGDNRKHHPIFKGGRYDR